MNNLAFMQISKWFSGKDIGIFQQYKIFSTEDKEK